MPFAIDQIAAPAHAAAHCWLLSVRLNNVLNGTQRLNVLNDWNDWNGWNEA